MSTWAQQREYGNGLGLGATGTQIASTSVGAAATIGGSNAAAIAGALGVAVPIVGTAIAGIALAVTAWLNRMGPKQKRWTTQIADEATAQLQAIHSAYFSTPYNPANQQQAIASTQQMLQAIQDGCGQTQMGDPGKRCIAERLVRGGSAPWCPTGTGCDYLTVYLDPIVNDPRAAEWQAQQAAAANDLAAAPGRVVDSITDAISGGVVMGANSGRTVISLALGLVAVVAFYKAVQD